jgi:hypothetical protein
VIKYKDKDYNLSTFFIAPLCFDSGAILAYIDNCYIKADKNEVVVITTQEFDNNCENLLVKYWNKDGKLVSLYTIPEQLISDFELFKDGKYSQMSKEAKTLIRVRSGLPFNVKVNNETFTHLLLSQLYLTPLAIKEFENRLGILHTEGLELISKIENTEYYRKA